MAYTSRIFNYVNEIPEDIWDDFTEVSNVYFSKPYLKSFEEFNSQRIQFFYIVVLNGNQAISLATIQVFEFDFAGSDFTPNSNRYVQKLSEFLRRKYVKIMICGSIFLSGEHGIYIKPTEDKKLVLEQIVKGIQAIVNANKYLKKWVDIILLKDFITASLPITNNLKQYNYTPIQVDPNMVLTLNPEWATFGDYLAAFKSKFRVKAKKAYKTSQHLEVKNLTYNDINTYKKELTKLYDNVKKKASFNPEALNLSTYSALKKVLNDDFIFYAYFLDDTLVGFMSGVINNSVLDAHYVGINYDLNKQHAIYSRMLYDYVAIGIERQVKEINFGRTAGEIKSTLGAVPQELTCYIRHKKSIANFLFKPFLKKVKPTVFEQRFPFKKQQ
ncbi:MAG: peptidogalycan biosysnthesis protein [Flavobacteriaceae bacterium]